MLSDRGPRIAVADVNHDALDDIYVCGASGQAGQLLIQQANGQFKTADTAVFNKYAATEEVDALFLTPTKTAIPICT